VKIAFMPRRKLFSRFSAKSQPEQIGSSTFMPLSWMNDFMSSSMSVNDAKLLMFYLSVPELQAVINYKARLFSSMIVEMKNTKTDELVEKHPTLDLLKQPNVLQNFSEFSTQADILRSIFGNGFIHNVFGTDPSKPQALFNLPPGDSEIVPVNQNLILFNQVDIDKIIEEYKFKYNDGFITYKPEEIIHSNDTQVKFDVSQANQYLKGQSKLQPLSQASQNSVTAREAIGTIQGNSPIGIFTNKGKDGTGSTITDPTAKAEVQENLKQYGLAKRKYQYIVTSMDLDFVTTAADVRKLQLFEEISTELRSYANAFSIPPEVFLTGVKYDNKKELDKDAYQNVIIPSAEDWLSILSKGLGLTEQNLLLIPNYSHVPALQEDLNERAKMWDSSVKALNKALTDGAINVSEYRTNLVKIGMIEKE
jgi:hypothetical protein